MAQYIAKCLKTVSCCSTIAKNREKHITGIINVQNK